MAPRKKITEQQLRVKIMNAAASKQQLGSRLSTRGGGQSVRSRTFRDASKEILQSIARDIIAEAKRAAEFAFAGDENGGFLDPYNDPRVKEHRRYVDSFSFRTFPNSNRPTIRIFNKATKIFYDGRKYPYGDSVEWGTPPYIVPRKGKYLALKVNEGIGNKFLTQSVNSKKVNLRSGLEGYINRVNVPRSNGSINRVPRRPRMKGIYLYTEAVPGRKPTGIIASAVDKVLGRRAGQEVRRRQ